MTSTNEATFVVELTPRGRAAVAVVLVAGPRAVQAVDACFHSVSGKRLVATCKDRILLGRWDGVEGEELIACRRGDARVEVHCHGGFAAVQNVMDRLITNGCQAISWQEWIRRSATDPICAAAQTALADAPTARTAAILLDQFHGALTRTIRDILEAVDATDWTTATALLDAVLSYRELGGHLTTPWQVVIAGRPNVGKSSLMNAIAGYQRAIVFDQPGTTRDVVTLETAIDGWPIRLADTAGLRATTDAVESEGVARANAAMSDADLIVFVGDVFELHKTAMPSLPTQKRVIRVLNKSDLMMPSYTADHQRWDLFTSAVTGDGIEELLAAISRSLVPTAPEPGSAMPFGAEQIVALEAARLAVAREDCAGLTAQLRPLIDN